MLLCLRDQSAEFEIPLGLARPERLKSPLRIGQRACRWSSSVIRRASDGLPPGSL